MLTNQGQDVLIVVLIFGLTLIVGQKLGWKIISDPPDEMDFYSQTILKRIFGKKILGILNYAFGAMLTVSAVWGLIGLSCTNAVE